MWWSGGWGGDEMWWRRAHQAPMPKVVYCPNWAQQGWPLR